MKSYSNRWIPADALRILRGVEGPILDVGGGAAPYYRADHILDIIPFDAERLRSNAWGCDTGEPKPWTAADYTVHDMTSATPWPFANNSFEFGVCSHCLEDLRDPLPAFRELCRVSKRQLLIVPSRLLEQTMGVDHPRCFGFHHHPWIIYRKENTIIFRRKTVLLNLPACHLSLPFNRQLRVEHGACVFEGPFEGCEEQVFWQEQDEYRDASQFIAGYRSRKDLFERRYDRVTPLLIIRHILSKYFGRF